MKKKLLFLAILLLTALQGFSQAEAYPAPDMTQCGNEVFDLTAQNPIILGNQDPEHFTVTYYLTQADAANGTNPIVNAVVFVSPSQQLIFAKVVSSLDGSSDITVFNISWTSGIFVPDLPDVSVCESYELPAIEVGNYYLSPGGVDLLPFGTVITQTQTIYIYKENDLGCWGESSFMVIISPIPEFNTPQPLYACDANGDGIEIFDLTDIIPQVTDGIIIDYVYSFHETQIAAELGVNAIANPQAFASANQTLYVSMIMPGTTTNCRWVAPFQLIVTECNGNTISGFASLNFDGNCESFEAAASGIPVYMTHNNDVYIAYTNADGYYSFENVPDGAATVYINAAPFTTVSPSAYGVTMPGNEEEKNFCITSSVEIINDVAVTFIPITPANSGFVASYAVIYQNLGTTTQSGNVTLQFDGNNLVFLNAIPAMAQSGNTLTLNYGNLMPFQSKVALVYFTVNVPQITPQGTVLNFTATITPLTGDVNPANNTSVVSQVVVTSFDPNDISVREGKYITDEQANDYLNYTVRFQNSGDANAQFVRIVVVLDENLDWSTFEAISGSDAFTVKRSGNEVEFMFDDIDLPYEDIDEPGSHGHIIYRIKPKAAVTVGDSMAAQADIYFDFNDPISTASILTTVQNVAGINDNEANSFTVYPNPASGNVNLMLSNSDATGFNVIVTDVLGKTVLKNDFQGTQGNLAITSLTSGVYFINITASGKQSVKKLIVK